MAEPQYQFDRFVRVLIGPAGQQGVEFSDLRIQFNVKKTSDKSSNTAEVKIYNLNENSRNRISGEVLKQVIQLNAGYKSDVSDSLVFIGNVTSITHEVTSPSIVTTIKCADGLDALSLTRISVSYTEGYSVKLALREIVDAFPFGIEGFNQSLSQVDDFQFSNGYSFTGFAKDALDELTQEIGVEWSVQNGNIKFLPEGLPDSNVVVSLSPTTGLVGSPIRLDDTRIKKTQEGKPVPGWRIKALLKPTLDVGSRVRVESKLITDNTDFKIVDIQQSGDNQSGQWNSTITIVNFK